MNSASVMRHDGVLGLSPERRDREVARWSLSVAIVVALHAAAAALLVSHWTSAPTVVSDAPAAVLIDMAPPPSAPEAPASTAPPNVAEPESAAPMPTLEPTPEAVPDVPQPTVEAMVAPEPAPLHAVEPLPVEAPPLPAPKDAVVLPAPPRKPAPAAKPQPKTVVRKPPRPVQADTRGDVRLTRRPPAEASGARTADAAPSVSSGASAASKAQWQSQLVAYLQRNLRYPAGSGNGGSAAVSFSMDRYGRVLSARIARSAGSAELDAAALATFRGTLPPAPSDVAGSTFAFTIPVRFNRS